MEKYLILKGCAGLGNRLITLMKAIKYSQKNNRTIYVDWADGMFGEQGDNVFFKYFNLKNIKHITSSSILKEIYIQGGSTFPSKMQLSDLDTPVIRTFYALTPNIARNTIYKVLMTQIFKEKWSYFVGLQSWQRTNYKHHYYWNAIKNINNGNNFPLGSALTSKHKEDLVFFADFRPLVNIDNLFSYLELKPEIQSKISSFAEKYNIKEAIGVHIRYTDKKPKRKLNKLIQKLDKILSKHPEQKIFLCSDNIDIINEFKKKYKNNIIQTEKYLPETNNVGIHIYAAKNLPKNIKEQMMEESLMDMWLLSMTKLLFWQGNSSFSYISKYIKNDPKTTINWMGLIR